MGNKMINIKGAVGLVKLRSILGLLRYLNAVGKACILNYRRYRTNSLDTRSKLEVSLGTKIGSPQPLPVHTPHSPLSLPS